MNSVTIPNPCSTKKLVQVSEEVQKPVHIPVVLGNECFIITQQDVRKIEDSRFLSYHKLGAKGELIPVETISGHDVALRDAIMTAAALQNQNQGLNMSQNFLEILKQCCGQSSQQPQPQPQPIVASIAQQMEWANTCNTTTPAFPFTYSKSTSMNELPTIKEPQCCSCSHNCCCRNCAPKYITHQGCNTSEVDPTTQQPIEGLLSARKMLKIRKSIEDILGI